MYFFDPHIHVASRTTDDLELLAKMGCVVVGEPAFWPGFDRSGVNSFYDYFRQLTEWEPKRCAQYRLAHYCWLGVNAKEAERTELAREVIACLPEFLDRPNVLGIGEIGLNKNTKNEVATLERLIDLAAQRNEQMLFHTPHLADKYAGTRMILDLLRGDARVDRSRVCIDHCEEHTIRLALDEGYWAGITLYPTTKATPERAADMVEVYGPERILVNSSADWGPSRPSAVPDFILVMRRRGHPESVIRKLVYDNPLEFFNQSRNFQFTPRA
ncbi:MAG: TatD family hydrolase [Thermoguttaceae bacterium]|jgi:predicted metal-dependent TIM-barrel fold hydrolase|nr:TatD family hydrolase [Thermoguttaceae bacterium]